MTSNYEGQALKPPPSAAGLGNGLQRRPPQVATLSAASLDMSSNTSERSLRSLPLSVTSQPSSRSTSPGREFDALNAPSIRSSPGPDGVSRRLLSDSSRLIPQAFVPRIAVHASEDTEELVREKGITGGLCGILRPFGDQIQGKVTIRESTGAGRTWNDFGVRFVQIGSFQDSLNGEKETPQLGGNLEHIDSLLKHVLNSEELHIGPAQVISKESNTTIIPSPSQEYYDLFLRRLLSEPPMSPHETFTHPVACVIAISSRNTTPIETLRELYESGARGDKKYPHWVNNEYLRYYVLVHDEDRDDIAKSTSLFDQMKRHFGLHCHLLRLKSSQCVSSDDDAVQVPPSIWTAAGEDLQRVNMEDSDGDITKGQMCLVESDVSALRTFVREMITSSIVPFMERCITTWNDQVASRRRGIGGRFMSLSKKWTGFGGSGRGGSAFGLPGGGSSSNYDASQGIYNPVSPEAVMQKLADYAFMLRDFKLAYQTYDLLRTDFSNDKAWKYYAGANELAALSYLLTSQPLTSKMRTEITDKMLDAASYSYITRCSANFEAIRCYFLAIDLLRFRGGPAADDAAKLAFRLIESEVLTSSILKAFLKERVAASYCTRSSQKPAEFKVRKCALWNVLTCEAWLENGMYKFADTCLSNANALYGMRQPANGTSTAFSAMNLHLQELELSVKGVTEDTPQTDVESSAITVVQSEKLDYQGHRKSQSMAGAFSDIDALGTVEAASGDKSDDFT